MSITTEEIPNPFRYQAPPAEEDEFIQKFQRVREQTRRLAEPLELEDCVVQSMEDASPTKWHLAHTSWFFETFVLAAFVESYRSPFPQYDFLFNSYYVQAGERYPRTQRGLVTRPTVEDVFKYRSHVDGAIMNLLAGSSAESKGEITSLVEIGLNHEQQHQELILTDLKHLFSFNPLFPVYADSCSGAGDPGALGWAAFEEGLRWIGAEGEGFSFDNEHPRHRQFVPAFQLADRLVTNAEYLEFMKDGGYHRATLWLSEGWAVAETEGWKAPLYWLELDGEWHYFTLGGLRRVDPQEPVCHVSHFEADAYARWVGARLPTEAEWETAAADSARQGNFVESGCYHPRSAQPGQGALRQMFGDVWEWTQSAYLGYPGYRPQEGALGEYNGKFMSNQMVLRGGSCATPESHIRATYRNFFKSCARWQFSGIRLAKDA